MLSDAVNRGATFSLQQCHSIAQRELNLAVLPPECHDDLMDFYCGKIRDVASEKYTQPFSHECRDTDGAPEPDMEHVAYAHTRLGYVVLAHKHWQNVVNLLMRLYEPDTTAFVVHVDVKSPGVFRELSQWREREQMEGIVELVSEFNVVRGGPAMLQAELLGMRMLLNSSLPWEFCILLSEFDYPLRSNRVLADYLFVHRGTNFVSVDEGECERDVSFQCGERVVSLSGGIQYPKVPGLRYGSGSQWFALTRALAGRISADFNDTSTVIGTIYRDLTSVKQPDESFFQAVILNTQFCTQHIDYTLHWTDKDSLKEVRSDSSEYNILSPGVLGSGADYFKLAEVRQQSLWAFFARKFDDSKNSASLKMRMDQSAGENARLRWAPVSVPSVGRVVEALSSSLGAAGEVSRLDRNKDGLFAFQTLRVEMQGPGPAALYVREKMAMPTAPHPVLAMRIGCNWNKTELVFEGDVSLVSTSSTGVHRCETLWAVAHWRMSRQAYSQELVLVWIDPKGTPMQHAPITVSENSVLLWHRYTATLPLPRGKWTVQLMTPARQVLLRRTFYAYGDPRDIPWSLVHEYFEVLREEPSA